MSFLLLDYQCAECGVLTESFETRSEPARYRPCHCGGTAERCISPVMGKMKLGEVTRGRAEPMPPNALDTRPLGEGMPRAEWEAKYRKPLRDRNR